MYNIRVNAMSCDKEITFDVFSASHKENNDSDASDCDDHEPAKSHLSRRSGSALSFDFDEGRFN